jgi:hypothetical protein
MVFLVVGIVMFLDHSGTASAQTNPALTNDDCGKCHAERANDIAVAGEAHRTVGCSGCHAGHPPQVKKPFAPCDKCHLERTNAHFRITGCLNCHTNPHRPLNITFKSADKDACLLCHGTQYWQFREYESKHTALNCSRCHDVHRKFPQCVQCHKPHSGKIVGDCKPCHAAHMPKVNLPDTVPSKVCGSCHTKAADLLSATASKHKSLACSGCHQGKHRTIPACQDCHGTPHPEGIRVKFPKCGDCHNIAHDLNNWPAAET